MAISIRCQDDDVDFRSCARKAIESKAEHSNGRATPPQLSTLRPSPGLAPLKKAIVQGAWRARGLGHSSRDTSIHRINRRR